MLYEVITDARYQFLLDLMSAQRRIGRFGFFMTEAERAARGEGVDVEADADPDPGVGGHP